MRTYALVKALGPGSFKCGLFGGWIHIEKKNEWYDVHWTSSKETHNPLCGSSYIASVHPNGMTDHYRSVLSMWPISNSEEQFKCEDLLSWKIQKAARRKGIKL